MTLKRMGKIVLAVALFGSGLGLGSIIVSGASSGGNAPGSANDPIVTKSYVDEAIRSATGQAPSGGGAVAELVTVTISAGEMLLGGKGSEFVVRTGKPKAFSSTKNGVSDLTAGTDILNGESVPLNHLLLFPAEGRGIQISDGKSIVLVRGPYMHLDADGNVLSR